MSKQKRQILEFIEGHTPLSTRQIDSIMFQEGLGYLDKKEKRRLCRLNWALGELESEGLIEKYWTGGAINRWRLTT